jgi:hypothetical protein
MELLIENVNFNRKGDIECIKKQIIIPCWNKLKNAD